MGRVISYAKNNSTTGNLLSFKDGYAQKINLNSLGNNAIGIQNTGAYFRTNEEFNFYKEGVHTTIGPGVNGTHILKIDGDGDATFIGTVTTLGSLSDANTKINIEKIPDALDKVTKISGVFFDYKDEFVKNEMMSKKQVGLIAQEVENILPEAIHIKDGKKYIEYDFIIPLIVEALKELNEKINDYDILKNEKNNNT